MATILVGFTLSNFAEARSLTLEERAAVYESYAWEAKASYDLAAQKMNAAYQANSSDFFVNLRMGWLFSLAKKYKNSVDHYEAAAKIAPLSIDPWLGLSLLYLNLGETDRSLSASEQLLTRDPANYYGLLRTNMALIKSKRYSEALSRVDQALKVYPVDPTFLEQKGFLLVSIGKAEEAREPLSLLLLISPQNAYAKSILKN